MLRALLIGIGKKGGFSMTRFMTALVLVFVFSVVGAAIEPIPNGAKIFIAPMEGELHNFIPAELMKRKVPVTVVTDESVESVPIVVEGLGRRCKQASYYAALDPVALAGLRMASSIHRSL